MTPKTSILIVTFHRDFAYLAYCLRSIKKFATGFHEVCLMVPERDKPAMAVVESDIKAFDAGPLPLRTMFFDEWEGKGMNHHQYLEMTAPQHCPSAEAILHVDADMCFTRPTDAAHFFDGGKPHLTYTSYDQQAKEGYGHDIYWAIAVANATGIDPLYTAMQQVGIVHLPEVYAMAEQVITAHTKRGMADYVASTKNSYPQGFAEYPTLGTIAWELFRDDYHWHDKRKKEYFITGIQQWSGQLNIMAPVSIHLTAENRRRVTVPKNYMESLLK